MRRPERTLASVTAFGAATIFVAFSCSSERALGIDGIARHYDYLRR